MPAGPIEGITLRGYAECMCDYMADAGPAVICVNKRSKISEQNI